MGLWWVERGSEPPHCSEPHLGVGTSLLCPHWGFLLLGLQNPSLLLETVMSLAGAELRLSFLFGRGKHTPGVEGTKN